MLLLLDFPTGILQKISGHIIYSMPHCNHAFCAGVMESCPSSPLFIPLGMERPVQKTRKLSKDGGALSTDSEEMNGSVKESRNHKRHKRPRSQRGEGQGLEESQPHKDGNELEGKPPSNTKEQLQTSAKEHVKSKENSVTENKMKVPGEYKSFPAIWFSTLYCACERTRPLDRVACQHIVKL